MSKKVLKGGESLPLARTSSLATPSSGGHLRNAPEDTPIEALYELPDGWKWCMLGDIAEIKTGKKDANYGSNDGLYPFFTCAAEPIKCNGYSFDCEAILLAGNGDISNISLYSGKFEAYQRTYVLQFNPSIDRKYVYYHLKLGWVDFNKDKMYGSTIPYIRLGNLKSYPIPFPPTLVEQQRIVNRVETMFAKLDQAQEKAQAVLDSFETRKAAILHKAFSGELTANWRKENGVADDSWEEKKIGECCKLGSGGTPSKSHTEYYENGDIPWLKTGEIDWNDIYDVEEKITTAGVANSSAKIYPAESVVVAMYGMGVTRGKAGILKIPTTTNQAVCVLQPNESLFNRYLFYYFMCNYWTFREKAVGGNQLNYSATMISKWSIELPTITEQQEIVRILDTVLEKEMQAKDVAQTVLDQIALLKKTILARAFKEKI